MADDFNESSLAQALGHRVASGLRPGISKGAIETAKMVALGKALRPHPALADTIAALKPMTLTHGLFATMGAIKPIGIDPSIIGALSGIRPLKIDPALGLALQNAQKALAGALQPLGGAAKAIGAFEEQQRAVQKALLASLAGPIGNLAKTGQWASRIGALTGPDIASIFGGSLGSAVDEMRRAIAHNFTETMARDQVEMSAMLGLTTRLEADFAATRFRMSALAGLGETLNPLSNLRFEAYHSLFGAWRTRPDLPENFWRDGRVRKRMYREADVDDGLVVATPGVALEVMIESGLAAGLRSETNAVAVVTLGEVSMTVRSRGTRKDAYAILERFEIELRGYISRKLSERFGADWFKLRTSNLIGKAKGTRKAAMERGEAFAPLIEFTELGELAGIVLSTRNWDEVFGDVFVNRAEFGHDMQKLVAARRPTMHIRSIDGVRLVELICVVQRLSEQMADDGAWKRAAESDF